MEDSRKGIIYSILFAVIATVGVVLLVYFTKGRFASEEGYTSPAYFAMDTTLEITIRGKKTAVARELARQAYQMVREIEVKTSRFMEGSDVSRINANAGVAPVRVSIETLEMIRKSIEYSKLSDGAFDISIAPIVRLYGFYDRRYRVPSESEIRKSLPLVSYTDVCVDARKRTVFLRKPGMEIDLGGVAKGYSIEMLRDFLLKKGVRSALINFGGSIAVIGKRNGKDPWVIGIKHPRGKPGDIIGTVEMEEGFISSSGDYERYFVRDGSRYFHIFDPKTGKCPSTINGSSVAGPAGLDTDILSTAIVVVGAEKGLSLVSKLQGYGAIIVTDGGKIKVSRSFRKKYRFKQRD